MKKKILVALLAFAVLLCASCDAKSGSKKNKKDHKSSKTTVDEVDDEEDEDNEETEESEEITEFEETTEESVEAEATTAQDIETTISDSLYAYIGNVSDDQIVTFYYDDYDMNGTTEAFVFVGVASDMDDFKTYDGAFYFVSGNDVELVSESFPTFMDMGQILDFGSRKYFLVNQLYTTSNVTEIYSVDGDSYFEDEYSRFGALYNVNGNEFTITLSDYDGFYDTEMEMFMGHTWKPYYFSYFSDIDAIEEYKGTDISIEEAAAYLPEGVLDEVIAEGYVIDRMYIRSNGIVNVNYHKEEYGSVYYGNLNYDTVNQVYIDAYSMGEDNSWEHSSFGGIYYSNIYGN